MRPLMVWKLVRVPPQPPLVDVPLAGAFRLRCDDVLGLLLGAHEQDFTAVGRHFHHGPIGIADQPHGLLQIDDVDAVALGEDVASHPGVPPAGLVTEVDTGLQQRLHSNRFKGGSRRGCGGLRRAFGGLYHKLSCLVFRLALNPRKYSIGPQTAANGVLPHAYPLRTTCHCERSVAISSPEGSSLNSARSPRRFAPRDDKLGTREECCPDAYPLRTTCHWRAKRGNLVARGIVAQFSRDRHVASLLAMTNRVRVRSVASRAPVLPS